MTEEERKEKRLEGLPQTEGAAGKARREGAKLHSRTPENKYPRTNNVNISFLINIYPMPW
jgi:hypothetical protein